MRLHRSSLPAVVAVLFALGVVPLVPGTAAADTTLAASCNANLRSSPTIPASGSPTNVLTTIPQGMLVTVTGTVQGDAWSAACPTNTVSGNTWYTISAVNGTSVSTKYNVAVGYAASGLFAVPPPPPPPGMYLEGIDVSHYQGTIAWNLVPMAGKSFVIMKATQGETYVDPTYATNHAGARAAGLAVTAYHFADPSTAPNDAILQADNFVMNAALLPGDLVPALDLEENNGLSVAQLQAWVQAWLDEVYLRLGVRPMIYTSPNFWTNYMGNTTQFADEGYSVLWVAHWGVTAPSIPANNWSGHGWTFWQYSNCGTVSGITGCVDLDRYNGTTLAPVTYNFPSVGYIPPPPPPPPAYTTPVLSSISPTTVSAGSGDATLTLQGANFASGVSTAYWNGMPLATTFVSSSQLTAVLPAAYTTVPTTGTVTVLNQAPGGGSSYPAALQVTLPPAQVTISPSTTVVSWGQAVTLNVHLGPAGANRTVTIQRMQANETQWGTIATLTTDADGNASLSYTPPVNTQFEAVFPGAPDLGPGTSTPVRVVVRQYVVLRPTNLGKVKSLPAGTSITYTATIRPIGPTLAPGKVTFGFWRNVGGHWELAGSRTVAADSLGKASTTWKFSSRGQWYVRAVADPTPTNANSYWSPLERYSIF